MTRLKFQVSGTEVELFIVAGLHLFNPQSSTQKVGWFSSCIISGRTCNYLLGCPVGSQDQWLLDGL